MKTSDAGIALITEFEGLVLTAYPDPGNPETGEPWTIGYGHTKGVRRGDTCTKMLALAWLREDLAESEDAVDRLVKVDLAQHEFDALVSFTFNCGAGALMRSTLLRKLNAGDRAGAAAEFDEWVNGASGPLPGLVRRRAAEKALFLGVQANLAPSGTLEPVEAIKRFQAKNGLVVDGVVGPKTLAALGLA